jgi:hypothetical protein
MTTLPINLLQILCFPIDFVHRSCEAVLVLLVLRVFRVGVVARAYQAIFVRVWLRRYCRVLLIDAIAV